MSIGLLGRLGEQARAGLLAELFGRSRVAKAVASLAGPTFGELVEVNAAFCELVGYRHEELVGRPCTAVFDPADHAALLANLAAMARGEHDRVTLERRLRRADGSGVWVTTRAVAARDGAGAPYVIIESIESGESQALAGELREQQAQAVRAMRRLEVTIEVQRDVTAAADDRDRVLQLIADRVLEVLPAGNASAVQLLDSTDESLHVAAATGVFGARPGLRLPVNGSLAGLALSTRTTLRCDDASTDARVAKEIQAITGVRSLLVAPLLGVDGPLGVLSVSGSQPGAFDDADAQQLTLLADALTGALRHADTAARNRDLLERADRERQRLERSERRFAEVFDHSPVAKMVLGLRGAERGKVMLANPAFSRLLGYPPDQAVTLRLADLIPPPHPDLEAVLDTLAAGEELRTLRETMLRRRDGTLVPVTAHTLIITDQDGSAAAVVQLLDATAQRVAAASEARFQLMFANSPVGLLLMGMQEANFGTYLAANPAISTIIGYSTEELIGMNFRQLLPPDAEGDAAELIAQALASGPEGVHSDRRWIHKQGHSILVSLQLAVVRDDDGRPRYLVTHVEDVTERRATLARLRQQAALLDLAPAAIIVRALDGRILWWNHGAEDLYGWSLDAVRGKPIHALLNTVFSNDTADGQNRQLRDEGHWEGQLEHVTATGRAVTVLSRQVLEAEQVLEINTDVTDARAAERALAESEQRFKAQFANSAVGQVVRALDGTMLHVNAAYAGMLGYTSEELTGVNGTHLLHPDDYAAAQREVAALFAGEADSYTQEGRLRHADGHWVDIEATVTLVRDQTGRPDHLIGVTNDITARRAAEQARDLAAAELAARNTELEDANRLKLDLIGMLGHEIGNPLAAILGYSELLQDGAALDDNRRTKMIDAIARQARRLDDIVQEVLSMVRIEAGSIHANREPVTLREHIDLARTAAGAEDVPVYGDDATALVNPGHLQHILTNLISNAAKYGGGVTAIRLTRIDGRVHIRVEDNGPGVPDEFRGKLFQRLARADRDANQVKGTGLGLYIVQNLAQANHGTVRHEPNPAGGSIFVVDLEAHPSG